MSVSLVTSEGSLPCSIPLPAAAAASFHFQQLYHRQGHHNHLNHHQNNPLFLQSQTMLVHNGRLPGGSPIPVPSPNSSLSHPESPRSQAADSSSSPPGIMTVQMEKDEEMFTADQDDEVLSIGGKDDEQMMMDCDSSVSDNNNEGGQSLIKPENEGDEEEEEGVTSKQKMKMMIMARDYDDETTPHERNQINGMISSADECDDKETVHSPKDTTSSTRCPSASTRSTPPASVTNDEEQYNNLEDSEDDRNSCKGVRSQSQKLFNPLNPHHHNHHHHHHQHHNNNPFTISSLSRRDISPPSGIEELYSQQIRSHNHLFNPFLSGGIGGPHPQNYFHPFFNPHNLLLSNHDTSSNHSTASSTNNSTSPSPSSQLRKQQQQQQQQQQTAAVAAAHSLIFSIANILRPDFGLCNNNNNNNQTSNKSPQTKRERESSSNQATNFGAKRHSQQVGTTTGVGGGGGSLANGKSQQAKGRHGSAPGHRDASLSHKRNSNTIPIDLSRPSSAEMISPNSIISMMNMLERGGSIQAKSRNQNHHHHQSKSGKEENNKLKHGKIVTPSPSSSSSPLPHPPEEQIKLQHSSSPEVPLQSNKSNNNNDPNGNNKSDKKNNSTPAKNNNNNIDNGNKTGTGGGAGAAQQNQTLWPAWVYCTRYSDRPSSGPRTRRTRKKEKEVDEKRPRTAFTAEQLSRLKKEFEENRYLTEKRRQDLARELKLHENQIKIWFQNKRAKLKKSTGQRGGLALQLMAQGLYNHSTIPPKGPDDEDSDDDDLDC